MGSTFVASILRVVYGIDAVGEDDPFLALVDDALDAVSQGMIPGRFLVEYLPFLRSMPPWFPGSGKQACFVRWRNANIALKEAPFEYVKMVRSCSISLIPSSPVLGRTRRSPRIQSWVNFSTINPVWVAPLFS